MIKAKPIIPPKLTKKEIELMIYGQTIEQFAMKQRKKYFPKSLNK